MYGTGISRCDPSFTHQATTSWAASLDHCDARGASSRKHTDVLGDADDTASNASGNS
jgi:hypothetical protein